jgi:histidyl-tRNA synthetase
VWFPAAAGAGADGADGAAAQHEVKDIRTGEQVAADLAAWTPPEEDLRPQVLDPTSTVATEEKTQ